MTSFGLVTPPPPLDVHPNEIREIKTPKPDQKVEREPGTRNNLLLLNLILQGDLNFRSQNIFNSQICLHVRDCKNYVAKTSFPQVWLETWIMYYT